MKPGRRENNKTRTTCLACGKPIEGPASIMRLQITREEPQLAERARRLGFTFSDWHQGGFLQGTFDKNCFKTAKFIWQVAFHTRLVSPRR